MRHILRNLRGADRPPRLRVPRAMRKVKPRRTPRTPRDPRKVRTRERDRTGAEARAEAPVEVPVEAPAEVTVEVPVEAETEEDAGLAILTEARTTTTTATTITATATDATEADAGPGDATEPRAGARRGRRRGATFHPWRRIRLLARLVGRPFAAVYRALVRAARRASAWFRRVSRPVALAAGAGKRLAQARPDDGTREAAARVTRQQRLALRARRLEVAAAATAVTVGLAGGLLLPGSGERVSEARESSSIAEGVSRPGAVDAPGAAPDAGSTANLEGSFQPSGVVAPPLPRSAPTRIRIPQLNTDVEVFGAELGTDGGPPSPVEEDAMRAAWYSGGAAPGERGPAIVVGHLDTYTGPAAFAGLGQLRPGELIEIDREDGGTALFEVDSVEQYPKADFPDLRVYGAVDTPQLRLITCGGRWAADGGYDSNIVAYAHLIGTIASPAGT
ncbi:class F sortase [Streptomyces mayteni]